LPAAIEQLPRIEWAEFAAYFAQEYRVSARDGADHVTIIGPTSTGKSTIAMWVAAHREWVCQFIEKPKDNELKRALSRGGYVRRDGLPDGAGRVNRVFIWPKHNRGEPIAEQRAQFGQAMADGYRVGGWHFVIHEGQHMVESLGLRRQIVTSLRMGRSNANGLIVCTGRPAWMPRDIYSSATHLFLFSTNDENDLRSIGGMNGVNNKAIRAAVESLDRDAHEVLYVNTRTRYSAVTRSPRGL
jgi:hypothetical protein